MAPVTLGPANRRAHEQQPEALNKK